MNYQSIIWVHTLIGFGALISFWVAALSKKGSKLHIKAGRFYLLSLIVILLSIIPMIIVKLQEGNIAFTILLGYLFTIVLVASFVSYTSIRNKNNRSAYYNLTFKVLATVLFLYGFYTFIMALVFSSFLQFMFSTVGISLGGAMWYGFFIKREERNWFLKEHMNGAAVNFAATHGSFFRFGLTGLLPIEDTPELNTVAQSSMIILALILRVWLGKKFLKNRSRRTTAHL